MTVEELITEVVAMLQREGRVSYRSVLVERRKVLHERTAQAIEALDVIQRTGEHHYEPGLYRLKGELSLKSAVRNCQHPAPHTQHPVRRRSVLS
jgi:hypothetical protein